MSSLTDVKEIRPYRAAGGPDDKRQPSGRCDGRYRRPDLKHGICPPSYRPDGGRGRQVSQRRDHGNGARRSATGARHKYCDSGSRARRVARRVVRAVFVEHVREGHSEGRERVVARPLLRGLFSGLRSHGVQAGSGDARGFGPGAETRISRLRTHHRCSLTRPEPLPRRKWARRRRLRHFLQRAG